MTAANFSPEQTTVLLIDDEQSVRSIVLKILRRAKYNVIEAENGDAALKAAADHNGRIDIVVTDMYMPGMRGPEVVDALSKSAAWTPRTLHVRLCRSGRENRRAGRSELSAQALFRTGSYGRGRGGAQRTAGEIVVRFGSRLRQKLPAAWRAVRARLSKTRVGW